eukprot:2766715-Rhodomonas_salina.1
MNSAVTDVATPVDSYDAWRTCYAARQHNQPDLCLARPEASLRNTLYFWDHVPLMARGSITRVMAERLNKGFLDTQSGLMLESTGNLHWRMY